MNQPSIVKAAIVRATLAVCICLSIGLMYYVNIIQKDYEVLTNPTGPDITDR